MDILLNVEQLKEEIKFLKNAHKIKMQLGALKLFSSCCRIQEDNSSSPSPQSHSENVKLLMAWVNAVCGFYSIKVKCLFFREQNSLSYGITSLQAILISFKYPSQLYIV